MQISLGDFDKGYLDSIPGKEEIFYSENGIYHTILCCGERVGVVGYVPAKFLENAGFSQTVIVPEFRGKGINKMAKDLLAEKYGLKTFFATIHKTNLASIKANQKIGFEMMSEEEMDNLRSKGFLKEDDIRMVKKYLGYIIAEIWNR